MMEDGGGSIYWRFDSAKPSELPPNAFLCALVPRPTVWLCVNDGGGGDDEPETTPMVSLVEGYNGAADRPPTVMMAMAAVPPSIMDAMRRDKLCSLSVATERDRASLPKAAAVGDDVCGPALNFADARLEPVAAPEEASDHRIRPPAVKSSPIQMHCRLALEVDLPAGQSVLLLQIETFVIRGSVLLQQRIAREANITTHGNADVRQIAAKIEAELLRPVGSLGGGRFGVLDGVYHMLRPVPSNSSWYADSFKRAPPIDAIEGNYNDVMYTYKAEDACKLGYNPTKQTIVPRVIGWISSFAKGSRVPHIAPYSFFCDVGRGARPMVAFAACPKTGGTDDWKDAHRDAMETGVFAFNICSADLADAMNTTAAAIPGSESEFELAGLKYSKATSIDAPVVDESPIVFECRFIRHVKVPEVKGWDSRYYLIIGEVLSMKVDKDVLDDSGMVDVRKLRPVARLGYSQEYSVVDNVLSVA